MRHTKWLVLAVGLLLIAGFLLPEKTTSNPSERPNIEFPRRTRESLERAQKRRTLRHPIKGPQTADAQDESEPPRPKDPMLVALPSALQTVILEANAILHSPVGKMMMECMQNESNENAPDMTRFVESLDRVAFAGDDTRLMTGHFDENTRAWLTKESGPGVALSDTSTLFGTEGRVFGLWDDQMLVYGSEDEVRATLDRLEGRTEPEKTLLSSDMAYGEAYGVISKEFMLRLMPEGDNLSELLDEAAQQIELHVDTQDAVAMTIDVRGSNSERIDELARSLGGGLAMMRVQARLEGDEELEHLLDQASVSPYGSGFTVEAAVSLSFLAERMKDCSPAAAALANAPPEAEAP